LRLSHPIYHGRHQPSFGIGLNTQTEQGDGDEEGSQQIEEKNREESRDVSHLDNVKNPALVRFIFYRCHHVSRS
jgi:hypothetical protein